MTEIQQSQQDILIPPKGHAISTIGSCDFIKIIELPKAIQMSLNHGSKLDIIIGTSITKEAMKEPISRAEFFNPHNEPIMVKIIFGRGEYKNDAIFIGNTINAITQAAIYSQIEAETADIATPTTINIPSDVKEIIIQNTGQGDIRLGGAGGFKLFPDNAITLNYTGDLQIFGTSTISLTRLG